MERSAFDAYKQAAKHHADKAYQLSQRADALKTEAKKHRVDAEHFEQAALAAAMRTQ